MATKAILLVNLGSPDSYEVKDVKKYLGEFLMDEKVIDIPYLPRLLLVKGIIVPFRSPKSAAKNKSNWTSNGSPLIHYTRELTALVAQQLHFCCCCSCCCCWMIGIESNGIVVVVELANNFD